MSTDILRSYKLPAALVTAVLSSAPHWYRSTTSHTEEASTVGNAPPAITSPVGNGTNPYWLTRKTATPSPPATSPSPGHFSQVVVIGAGMSGASAAMHLAQQGISVTLMDARGVSNGASGRNGGFLAPPPLASLILSVASGKSLMDLYNEFELIKFEQDTRAAIREFVTAKKIACELDRDIDVYQVFNSSKQLQDKMGLLWPLRSMARIAGVEVLSTRDELRDALSLPEEGPWCSGLRLRRSADTFCAADVVKQCVAEAVTAGAKWMPETRAVELKESLDHKTVTVVTDSGSIECETVIVATNAYIPHLVPSLAKCITPVRNHVGVSNPISSLTQSDTSARCGISAEDGFVYLHQRPDGRIVVGGFRNLEDEKGVNAADDSVVVEHVAAYLQGFIPSRFDVGNDAKVDQVWTGIIGWSCDDLPWVGPVPNHPLVYVCGGFSGHGLTQTFLCGKAVAQMAIGQEPGQFVRRFLPSLDRKHTADLISGHTSHHS